MRVAAVLIAALSLATAAPADIGIVRVAPSTVRAGGGVSVTVAGYVGLRAPTMPIVLVPAARMPKPYACKLGICEPIVWRGRLARPPYRVVGSIGAWRTDRKLPDHAAATLRFRAPHLAAGRYVVALWCGPCVRGPQGSLIAGPTLTLY